MSTNVFPVIRVLSFRVLHFHASVIPDPADHSIAPVSKVTTRDLIPFSLQSILTDFAPRAEPALTRPSFCASIQTPADAGIGNASHHTDMLYQRMYQRGYLLCNLLPDRICVSFSLFFENIAT